MGKKSLLTRLGKLVKKWTGIADLSLAKKQIHKAVGRIFHHKKYGAQDIVNQMALLGLKEGSIVCIHASMKEFYNYEGTPEELISRILEIIGPEGTLMMPAFPRKDLIRKPGYVFDVEKDPTGAGLLAETFRNYPGVVRSINVQHSVCAIGKYAAELTRGHENTRDCWDKNSPWYRLCRLNGLVFNLGMPSWYIGTFEHCVESLLRDEHPYYAQFFTRHQEWNYYAKDGSVKTYSNDMPANERRTRERKVRRYFSPDEYRKARISNLKISVYEAGPCLDRMLMLGRKGITIYYVPDPRQFEFPQ